MNQTAKHKAKEALDGGLSVENPNADRLRRLGRISKLSCSDLEALNSSDFI